MHKFDKFETPVLIVLLFFYLVNFLILIYNNIHLEDTSLYNTANIIIIRTFNSSETYEMVLPNLISIPTFLVSIYFIFLYIYGLKNKVEVINKGNYNTYTVTLVIASALLMSSIIYTIFLNSQCSRYIDTTSDERKVIDFIAGMTDDLFVREVKRVQ